MTKSMNSKIKKALVLWTMIFLSSAAFSSAIAAEAHPKYGPKATPLIQDHRFFREADAKDFWRLMPFYVPQRNDYSCSVASMAIVFNAAIKGRAQIPDTERNITQETLLKSIREVPIRELLSKKGFQGKHGVTLDELRAMAEQTARELGVRATITAHSFQNRTVEDLREILRANEEDPADFLLIHFVQDDLTGARGGPYAHISPIGAYNGDARRVLILDVDRQWYSPYWVADHDLLAAMNHVTQAFGAGGLVHIRFESSGGPTR